MKHLLLVVITVCVGVSQGRHVGEGLGLHEHVLTRYTRSAHNPERFFLLTISDLLVNRCYVNNQSDIGDDLKTISSDMVECLRQKQIFSVNKEEYIEYLEQCTQNFRTKSKLCLSDKQQFYPDVVLGVDKSTITHLYESHSNDAYKNDVENCVKLLNNPSVFQVELECRKDAYTESLVIPESKELFCRPHIVLTGCKADTIKQFCDKNDNVEKYRKFVNNYFRKPCGEEV